jgi:hypothetical protein
MLAHIAKTKAIMKTSRTIPTSGYQTPRMTYTRNPVGFNGASVELAAAL